MGSLRGVGWSQTEHQERREHIACRRQHWHLLPGGRAAWMVQKSASSAPTRAWRPRSPVISPWPSANVRLSYTARHPLTKTWLLPAHCSPTFYYCSVPSAPSREKRTQMSHIFSSGKWEERVFITKTTELNSVSQHQASLLANIFLPPM